MNSAEHQHVMIDPLWLFDSSEGALLRKLRDAETNPRLAVLWEANGQGKPEIDTYPRVITWPDGSVVTYAENREA